MKHAYSKTTPDIIAQRNMRQREVVSISAWTDFPTYIMGFMYTHPSQKQACTEGYCIEYSLILYLYPKDQPYSQIWLSYSKIHSTYIEMDFLLTP